MKKEIFDKRGNIMKLNIQRYMTRGVIRVVTDSLRATSNNKAETAFMKEFAKASRLASKKRYASEKAGEHIPHFLLPALQASAICTAPGAIPEATMPAVTRSR